MTTLLESIKALTSLLLSLSLGFFWRNGTRYQIHETYSRVAFLLVSVIKAELAKTNTSFLRYPDFFEVWNCFSQSPLLVIVVTDDLACIFLIFAIAYPAWGVSCTNTGDWEAGVLVYLRLVVVPLFFPSSFFVRNFAGRRGVW